MVTNQIIKTSPHGSFIVTQLSENIVICEDIHNKQKWGNATEDKPAFMVYLGCSREEAKGTMHTFNNLYGCQWCEVRNPKYLKDFECEIKVKGMNREKLAELVEQELFKRREFYAELITVETDEEGIPWSITVGLEGKTEYDAYQELKTYLGDEFKDYKLIGIFPVGKDDEF